MSGHRIVQFSARFGLSPIDNESTSELVEITFSYLMKQCTLEALELCLFCISCFCLCCELWFGTGWFAVLYTDHDSTLKSFIDYPDTVSLERTM